MADNKLHLKIITPEKIVVDETVDAVYSRAVDGEFGVLPGHIPYMTALTIGETRYILNNQPEYAVITGGIFEVNQNNVTILADTAELGRDIDLARANAAKERAETRLRAAARDIDADRAHAALVRAIIRIQTAHKAKRG